MGYYKVTFTNNYCGCDEIVYIKAQDAGEALDNWAEDYLLGCYSFYEPDSRFVDPDDYEHNDDYENAIEEYQAECSYYIEECTEEEYMDNESEQYWEEI